MIEVKLLRIETKRALNSGVLTQISMDHLQERSIFSEFPVTLIKGRVLIQSWIAGFGKSCYSVLEHCSNFCFLV
jgi:hypothetical protein